MYQAKHASTRPPPGTAKKRILVVDDQDATRSALAWLLGDVYEVTTAADGAEGLELAQAIRPDLVVADVWMPKMNGVQMVELMKAIPKLHAVPVIFLTGQDSPMSVISGIVAGARNYLVKPIDPALLEEKIRRALGV